MTFLLYKAVSADAFKESSETQETKFLFSCTVTLAGTFALKSSNDKVPISNRALETFR